MVGSYESGWGVRVVLGASNYDGMCRPLGYQVFVFADGLFAGTVAPVPMDSRTDGAAGPSSLVDGDRLNVTFSRYAPSDPLCCPSRTSSVTYAIDRAGAAPVLRATSVFTTPLSRT
ncbi:MAG: LppP/LprE family lipoprotein [Dehalococcoidia bacterium]